MKNPPIMKTTPIIRRHILLPVLLVLLVSPPKVDAQFYFWNTEVTNGQWSDPSSWVDETVPNEAGDVVFFENTNATLVGLENYTATAGELLFSGNTTLGSTETTNDILNLAMPDESQPNVEVGTSTAAVFMYADLVSTNGFQKTGPGKLTFRFNGTDQNYTGNVVIGSGILGINQNGSLGASNNGIVISNGARLLAEPGANTGTITIPASRAITLAGAQSQFGASPAAVNLVIEGSIGENATNSGLVKTDGGTVTLLGNLGYSGETRIAGGALVLGGSAALPATQNLRFNGTTGTLDVGPADQAARVIVWDNTAGNKTITGSGGGLTLSGQANQAFTTAINGVVYDLSGLSSFIYNPSNNPSREIGASAGGGNVTNTVNFSRGTNDITAQFIRLGGGTTNAPGLWTVMKFGQVNNLNASDQVFLGNFQGNANVSFYPELTNAVLRIRGAAGGETPVPQFRVANTSSGNRPTTAIVDLTGGSLDVVATQMDVAINGTGGSWTASTGILTMPDGNVVADTLSIARVATNHAQGTPVITGTLNHLGGVVTANTLVVGNQGGINTSLPTLLANYNLTGGVLVAGAISTIGTNVNTTNEIATVRNLNLDGGTLRNKPSENLSVNGVGAEPQNRLNLVLGAAGGTLEVGEGNSISLGSGALVSGPGPLNKAGAGTLVLAGPAAHLGNTALNAGALELAPAGSLTFTIGGNGTNNALTGTGTALLDGTVLFDLAAASTTDGDSWTVIAPSVGKTYGPGFLVGGFNGSGGTWTLTTNDVTYEFVQSTGVLSVSGDAPVDNYASWVGYWQTASGGTFTNTAGDADPDGDGFDNNMEFAFDGNPTVGTPALLTATKSGADAVFNFVARKDPPGGAAYQVQATADLAVGPWTNSAVTVSNSLNQTGILVPAEYERREFTVPASAKDFYRVRATIGN
jgi:autotransporter-associated beta strand protein